MTDNWQGNAWGSGPATTPANDQWNSGPADATDWNDGGAGINSFDDPPTADDTGPPGDGDEGTARARGGCFNCGEEGHNKADCTKPRVFTGTCRTCNQEGHRASDCPSKPKFCKQCMTENDHDTIDCKNKKVVDNSSIPEVSEKEAWAMVMAASDDLDVDDFKEAVKILSKANPDLTYVQIEKELRKRGSKIFLIGLKKEVAVAYTNVSLQGDINKTYTLGVFTKTDSCPRPILMPAWPKGPEDNLARLEHTGLPMERGIQICNNCGEPGHLRKDCEQERAPVEAKKISCVLCDQDGHRARDCSRECPEEKNWDKVTCRHCGETGHASESRCNPEKKAAFQAAKAAEEGADDGFGSNAITGGNDEWNASGNDTNNAGSATWDTGPEPKQQAITAGGW
ncbi:hypothetical protein LTS08_007178 [Lithohypha guttulata]|uniref:CCHC-type domain-containing protein n=1 Tax=Lithohypha guttulata TaxID=1690604 RepID=A0AAN7T0Z8_9EURO|nr:hypothetical protein LTR05_003933 [Lithohypha guttulata]KAK5097157.1 hypothetical protein LTS08_007178 [Lithohypha guttulata]